MFPLRPEVGFNPAAPHPSGHLLNAVHPPGWMSTPLFRDTVKQKQTKKKDAEKLRPHRRSVKGVFRCLEAGVHVWMSSVPLLSPASSLQLKEEERTRTVAYHRGLSGEEPPHWTSSVTCTSGMGSGFRLGSRNNLWDINIDYRGDGTMILCQNNWIKILKGLFIQCYTYNLMSYREASFDKILK